MSSHQQLVLEALPLELLNKIASHLEFSDLTALRQTSTILQLATEARPMWMKLVQEYSSKHFTFPCPPTQSLTTLDATTLRVWLVHQLTVNAIWSRPAAAPRSIALDYPGTITGPCSVTILPGGKWALAGGRRGWIHYFDLSQQRPVPTELISPTKDLSTCFDIKQISFHCQSPNKFLIAFPGMQTSYGNHRNPVSWIHVWQIEETSIRGLSAVHVKSLPYCWSLCGFGALSLTGNLLVHTTRALQNTKWADVFQWKESDSRQLVRSRIRLDCNPDFINIIGGDRLLAIDPTKGTYLFDIPEPQPILDTHAQCPLVIGKMPIGTPSWSYIHNQPHNSFRYSRVSYDGTCHRLAIGTPMGILGLMIPSTRDESPTVLQLSNLSLCHKPVGIGMSKGCVIHDDGVAKLSYSWDQKLDSSVFSSCQHTSKEDSTFHHTWSRNSFDEETGRFICTETLAKQIRYLDFLTLSTPSL